MILELDEFEKAERDAILKTLKHSGLEDLEETYDGSASFHYEVHPSNIGDSLYLVFKGEKYYLSNPDLF